MNCKLKIFKTLITGKTTPVVISGYMHDFLHPFEQHFCVIPQSTSFTHSSVSFFKQLARLLLKCGHSPSSDTFVPCSVFSENRNTELVSEEIILFTRNFGQKFQEFT